MTLPRPSNRLAVLLAALIAAFALQASVASPAGAATSNRATAVHATVLARSSADGWMLWPGAHWCVSTGFIAGYQGVMCMNLEYQIGINGRWFMVSLEMKCGTRTDIAPCVSAQANYAFGGAWQSLVAQARCVPSGPTCDTTVTRWYSPEVFFVATGDSKQFLGRGDARRGTGGFTLPGGGQGFAHLATPTITIAG
jgi:hypothetical protein